MAKGNIRPNGAGRVDRESYARLARELSTGFPQMDDETDRLINTRVVGVRPDTGLMGNNGLLYGQENAPKFKGICDSCGNDNPNLFEWNRNDGYMNHYSCQGPDCPGGGDMPVAQDIHIK